MTIQRGQHARDGNYRYALMRQELLHEGPLKALARRTLQILHSDGDVEDVKEALAQLADLRSPTEAVEEFEAAKSRIHARKDDRDAAQRQVDLERDRLRKLRDHGQIYHDIPEATEEELEEQRERISDARDELREAKQAYQDSIAEAKQIRANIHQEFVAVEVPRGGIDLTVPYEEQ